MLNVKVKGHAQEVIAPVLVSVQPISATCLEQQSEVFRAQLATIVLRHRYGQHVLLDISVLQAVQLQLPASLEHISPTLTKPRALPVQRALSVALLPQRLMRPPRRVLLASTVQVA